MYLHHCGTTLKAKGVNECKLDLISIYFFFGYQQISKISKGPQFFTSAYLCVNRVCLHL